MSDKAKTTIGASEIKVYAGAETLIFHVDVDDYNQYLNEQMPQDKVSPAFNMLSRTVDQGCKEKFLKLVLKNGKPLGVLALQMAGMIGCEFGAEVQISLKKPSA